MRIKILTLLFISFIFISCQNIQKSSNSRIECIELTPETNYTVNGLFFAAGEELAIHPKTGLVMEGVLAEDTEIDGFKLKGDYKTYFYENGTLKGGYLNESYEFEQVILTNGHFSLYSSGLPQSGNIAENTEIEGVVYKKLSQIFLYESGNVRGGYLLTNTSIDGMIFQSANGFIPDIYFYEKGLVEMGYLNYYTAINNHYFIGFVKFYDSGKISEGYFAFDTKYGDYMFKKSEKVTFHENGKIKSGTLSKSMEINGVTYEKDTEIFFDKKGNCLGCDD